MLSTDADGLAIKIAKGLIKVTCRINIIPVEKEAIQSSLDFPVAEVSLPPAQPRLRRLKRRSWYSGWTSHPVKSSGWP